MPGATEEKEGRLNKVKIKTPLTIVEINVYVSPVNVSDNQFE